MAHSLNIISFDVPFPANYGGVIDVYYKLVWLRRAGVKIYLHCFRYGRQPAKELEDLCEKVYYYDRATGAASNFGVLPYTVKSRRSAELEKNLLSNDHPILFEVLHTCYLLDDPRFRNRKKIYRHSNIEHVYYNELSKTEKNFTKKMYLKVEAAKLYNFERILRHADLILAVSRTDAGYFQKKYPRVRTVYLPSFHPNMSPAVKEGHSDYLLFHGNLSISENYDAAMWLVTNVFSKLSFKVVIAGLHPPEFLKRECARHENIHISNSPNEEEMVQLIRNAQLHVLYTPQPTGLKLKLLNVLFKGRFILCNPHMLEGTGIQGDNSVIVCDTPGQFIRKINSTFFKDFTETLLKERIRCASVFDNQANVNRLIAEIFGG